MTSAVVVGGGIGGLVAGLLLKKSYDKVTIIEASPNLGGLLRSVQDDHGMSNKIGSSQIGFDILVYSIPTAL